MKIFAVSFCVAFLFALNGYSQDSVLSDYRWTIIDAKGNVKGRHENIFVEFKEKFYLIGGRGTNPVNVFDPSTETWKENANSPMEMHHF